MTDIKMFVDNVMRERDLPQVESPPLAPLPYVDMSDWDRIQVPEQEWTVLHRIPKRQCALFTGQGAAGKSTIALHLCAAHALSRDWLGATVEPGPAIFIDAEDDPNVMHRRLAAIGNHYEATFAQMTNGGLHLLSFAGKDAVMATTTRGGKIEPTAIYKQVLEACGDIKPKMIGIASSANVFAGNEPRTKEKQKICSWRLFRN
jgi:RecA-family ATPase